MPPSVGIAGSKPAIGENDLPGCPRIDDHFGLGVRGRVLAGLLEQPGPVLRPVARAGDGDEMCPVGEAIEMQTQSASSTGVMAAMRRR